jgi:hypothetical protein
MMNINRPPNLSAAHRTALESLAIGLEHEFGARLYGILVGGSVGRGTATDASDLDIFVLLMGERYHRQRRILGDVEVDLFFDPPQKVFHQIATRQNPVRIENYAFGWICYDPHGSVAELKRAAQDAYERGPRPVTPPELFLAESRCRDALAAIALAVDDADQWSVDYLCALLGSRAVTWYFTVFEIWDPPPKRRMAFLRDHAPEFVAALGVLWDVRGDPAERVVAARRITEMLFGRERKPLRHGETRIFIAPS